MARFDYKCMVCGHIQEEVHSMKESPVFYCPKCKDSGQEIQLERQFSVGTGFIIRGGTEASHWKEKRVRMERRKELGVKQVERYGGSQRLQPNVAGVEVDSWNDASKMAKEAGLNTESYEPMIEKEKRTSKISGIDDAAWKVAKEQKSL
jgi:putative FmdB family regulatory protein